MFLPANTQQGAAPRHFMIILVHCAIAWGRPPQHQDSDEACPQVSRALSEPDCIAVACQLDLLSSLAQDLPCFDHLNFQVRCNIWSFVSSACCRTVGSVVVSCYIDRLLKLATVINMQFAPHGQ